MVGWDGWVALAFGCIWRFAIVHVIVLCLLEPGMGCILSKWEGELKFPQIDYIAM